MAPTHRVDTEVFAGEGWIHDSAVRAAAAEFTTGEPVHGSGPNSNNFNTSASVAAARLRRAGGSRDRHAHGSIPGQGPRPYLYSAVLALRDWFREHHVPVNRINVVSEGVHARRTWFPFQKALVPEISVGILAMPDEDFPAKSRWRHSEGVKEIISEGAAYL